MIDENEDMIISAVDPLILEIYLYNNNYKDRLLISELKEKAHTITVPGIAENAFFVKADDMMDILVTKFKKDLSEFESTPYDHLKDTVTSIYFIDNMLRSFDAIKYFRINVSDSQVYSRKGKDSISFDYKIIHSRVDLPSICTPEYLQNVKRILTRVGFISKDSFEKSPYFESSAREIISRLRSYSNDLEPESEEHQYVTNLIFIFGNKLEKDNSIVLVIVDL
jgi:hypothetical protein